jgi:Uma2 family endonuclease
MTQAISRPPAAPPGPITYEEFLAWADDETHAEWVDGEVQFMSPVSAQHSDVGRFLLTLISAFVDARRAGAVHYEPFHMKTGPDLPGRSPDILFVAEENRSRLQKTHLEGPADLVVEIISPDSRSRDCGPKYAEYEQGGVREYWLIDPERQQAEFYFLGEDGRYSPAPLEEGAVFRSRVLEGLWLRVDWFRHSPLPSVVAVIREWGLL